VFCVVWHLAISHEYNSNPLAAVLHINKSNAAGNSKKVVHPRATGLRTNDRNVSEKRKTHIDNICFSANPPPRIRFVNLKTWVKRTESSTAETCELSESGFPARKSPAHRSRSNRKDLWNQEFNFVVTENVGKSKKTFFAKSFEKGRKSNNFAVQGADQKLMNFTSSDVSVQNGAQGKV